MNTDKHGWLKQLNKMDQRRGSLSLNLTIFSLYPCSSVSICVKEVFGVCTQAEQTASVQGTAI